MMKTPLLTLVALVSLVSLRAAEVTNLRCEYLENPLGIDTVKPRLNWKITEGDSASATRGIAQAAYQVLVASSKELLAKELGLKTWPETWSGWGSHVILVTATPGSWFYEGLAGIRPDPGNPGFKHFLLRPGIVTSVDWVKCSYESPYGRIASNWKREGDTLTMEVTVPANTRATVFVPTRDAATVTESGKAAKQATDFKWIRFENNEAVFKVGSGTYQFQSILP